MISSTCIYQSGCIGVNPRVKLDIQAPNWFWVRHLFWPWPDGPLHPAKSFLENLRNVLMTQHPRVKLAWQVGKSTANLNEDKIQDLFEKPNLDKSSLILQVDLWILVDPQQVDRTWNMASFFGISLNLLRGWPSSLGSKKIPGCLTLSCLAWGKTRKHPFFIRGGIPSDKLAWQWKMNLLKMNFLLEIGIFHCYVSLPEGKENKNWFQPTTKPIYKVSTKLHSPQSWWEIFHWSFSPPFEA